MSAPFSFARLAKKQPGSCEPGQLNREASRLGDVDFREVCKGWASLTKNNAEALLAAICLPQKLKSIVKNRDQICKIIICNVGKCDNLDSYAQQNDDIKQSYYKTMSLMIINAQKFSAAQPF